MAERIELNEIIITMPPDRKYYECTEMSHNSDFVYMSIFNAFNSQDEFPPNRLYGAYTRGDEIC